MFATQEEEEDGGMSSALFAMASLMMLLLPTLLLSTSTQKFTSVPLSIAGSAEEIPDRPGSPIKKILLLAKEDGFSLQAWVRTTDVRSHDLEERSWDVAGTTQLHDALGQLKKIDPTHQRVVLTPLPSSTTEDVIRWMDVLGSAPDGSVLFPEIVIEPAQ
jgi:hypothetical protein